MKKPAVHKLPIFIIIAMMLLSPWQSALASINKNADSPISSTQLIDHTEKYHHHAVESGVSSDLDGHCNFQCQNCTLCTAISPQMLVSLYRKPASDITYVFFALKTSDLVQLIRPPKTP